MAKKMKRASNPRRKARMQECHKRGEERKEARRIEQKKRESANKALVKAGKLTPWQAAKALHKERKFKSENVPVGVP